MKSIVLNLGFVIGAAAAVYGLWSAWEPLGFVAGGTALSLWCYTAHPGRTTEVN